MIELLDERTIRTPGSNPEVVGALMHTINRYGYRRGAEVGVWRGNTAETILLRCQHLEEYVLIDPWDYDLISFAYTADDHPVKHPEGMYRTTMGEESPPSSQADMDAMYADVQARFQYWPKARIIRGKSPDTASLFNDASLDFVFLDGLHLYEALKADINAWLPKIRPGGTICGDDFSTDYPGVKRALEECFGTAGQFSFAGAFWCKKLGR